MEPNNPGGDEPAITSVNDLPDDLVNDLAVDFAQIARDLASTPTVAATLAVVVAAAVELIPGCRYAGVLHYADDAIEPVASSDPLVERLDQLQVDADEGPCLDALRGKAPYAASADLADDPQFPRFGPRAAALGIRSALGLRLLTGGQLGALNLYSRETDAFDMVDRAKAIILASHCSAAIEAARIRAEVVQTNRDDLHAALASRTVIGQAQGILMERERITADQAFDILRGASQDLNVKLRVIAQRLVDTGEDPRLRPPPDPTTGRP